MKAEKMRILTNNQKSSGESRTRGEGNVMTTISLRADRQSSRYFATLFGLAWLLAGIALAIPTGARAAGPVLPTVTGPIATSPTNPMWMESQLNLDTYNYVEEEYFITGTANEYKSPLTSPPTVSSANVPYTDVILVRRPANRSNYSGHVRIEPIHPGNSGTAAALGNFYRWAYLNGDVWVGVQQLGNNNGPKAFNPTRYASLTFLAALPVYDILSQVAALLQSSSDRIEGLHPRDVIMIGFSATCGTVTSYLNTFHSITTLANGGPIVDGYIAGGCAPTIKALNVPVIRANTQLDFSAATRQPDSDISPGKFRLYEIAGASHFAPADALFTSPPTVLRALAPLDTILKPLLDDQACAQFGAPLYAAINDFPKGAIFDGILRNMEAWIQLGTAPPHETQPFVTDSTGKPILDVYGNFQGGVRNPWVDEPLVSRVAEGTGCLFWGYMVPLSGATLQSLYRDHADYVAKVTNETNELVRERWMTQDDATQAILQAQNSSTPEPVDTGLPSFYPPANGPNFVTQQGQFDLFR
jgi:hypothetical protein